jgi:hypothetical protein
MWYVIQDVDGPFLTNDAPKSDDVVLFEGNIVEAEKAHQRACADWEAEHKDMNGDFQ